MLGVTMRVGSDRPKEAKFNLDLAFVRSRDDSGDAAGCIRSMIATADDRLGE